MPSRQPAGCRRYKKASWQPLITVSRTACRRMSKPSARSLGAIMLDNLAYNEAAEHLKPEDFSLDSHRRIFTRMVDLAESSRPIDMITLVEELDRRKELEAIGDVG